MQVETAIINALKGVGLPSEVTPILSDRGGVEPPAPYLLINIIDTYNIGLPRKLVYHKEDNKVETLLQVKDYRVSLTFHAKASDSIQDWVQHFHTGLFSDRVDFAFTQQGLGLVEADSIVYQPQPVSGVNYKRAILDITLRAEVADVFESNSIQSVRIEGDVVDAALLKVNEVVVEEGYSN